MLDAEDIQNIDMSQFSVAGYVPPGDYVLTIFVNGLRLGAPREVSVYKDPANPLSVLKYSIYKQKQPTAGFSQTICISPDLRDLMGLKSSAMEKLMTSHDGECLDFSALTGVQLKVELATLSLKITIPQVWMEYRDPFWVPPALWEEGMNGGIY